MFFTFWFVCFVIFKYIWLIYDIFRYSNQARNAAIANSYFTCAINRVGTETFPRQLIFCDFETIKDNVIRVAKLAKFLIMSDKFISQ